MSMPRKKQNETNINQSLRRNVALCISQLAVYNALKYVWQSIIKISIKDRALMSKNEYLMLKLFGIKISSNYFIYFHYYINIYFIVGSYAINYLSLSLPLLYIEIHRINILCIMLWLIGIYTSINISVRRKLTVCCLECYRRL